MGRESRKVYRPPQARLPARFAAATCLILMGMVIVLAWTRESDNREAFETERARLSSAIDRELQRLTLVAIEASGREAPPAPRSDSGAYTMVNLDSPNLAAQEPAPVAREIVTALRQPLAEAKENMAAALRPSVSEAAEGAQGGARIYPRQTQAGFVWIGAEPFAWSLLPVQSEQSSAQRESLALLYYEAADIGFLTRAAMQAHTGFIRLHRDAGSAQAETGFVYQSAGEPVYVSWTMQRPGDRRAGDFGAVLFTIMALFTGLVAFHMTRRLAESEIENARLAGQDPLTGLPNRLLFTIHVENEIARMQRIGGGVALFYLDLDRFKEVNDSFGHDAGDALIIATARRIEECLGPNCKLGRFDGDEFGIAVAGAAGPRDCEKLAARILKAVRQPLELAGRSVSTRASIGIAVSPDAAEDRGEMMRRADLALHRAKNQGRGCFVFFDEQMNSDLKRQKEIEDQLRHAIACGELDVYYQPIVSAATQKLSGVEALVRWNHPVQGVISPHEFIAIAEERGMIADLGQWVLRRACEDARYWPGIKLAVNISAMQFRHEHFLANVKAVLAETGFDPARLELELTESVVVDDAQQAEDAIFELRAMGVRIALDDFGTGYSSLIYLRRFAIDKIKIDRSFVDSMEASNESMEIVRHVAQLGKRLGLTVTAEGVENEEQIGILEQFGCDELQGYLFGKPLSALHVPLLIASRKIRARTGRASAAAAA